MFGFFKRKTEREKLLEAYNRLMEEAYHLSKVNRAASDSKYAEADAIQKKLDAMRSENG
ncbi:MAG: Lacal_2735 family protein [Bacteroidetes bacterium]|nr:MAG: Lacal_2735 family protein [Bacteroidota bacterium]